jgi:hypothetical protein
MEKNRWANFRRILYTAERTVIQMGEPDQGIQFALLNPEIRKVQMCELLRNTLSRPERISLQNGDPGPGDHVPSALPTSEKDALNGHFW